MANNLNKVKKMLEEAKKRNRAEKNRALAEEENTLKAETKSDAAGPMTSTVIKEVSRAFTPLLEEIAKSKQEVTIQIDPDGVGKAISKSLDSNKDDIVDAISKIEVKPGKVTVDIPEVKLPDIKVPVVNVPKPEVTVKVPPIKIPTINIPETNFPDEMAVRGWIQLMLNDKPVGLDNPLAVTLRDADGSPVNFAASMSSVTGGGGGVAKIVKVSGVLSTVGVVQINPDGSVPVSSTGLTDTELRATSVPVSQVSGANYSVNVADAFGSTAVTSVFNADNRVRVSIETGGSGLTDAELRATSVPVEQVSGSTWSTEITATVGLTDTELRAASVPTEQVSGSVWSTEVTSTVGLTDTELRTTSVPVSQASGAMWSTSSFETPSASNTFTPSAADSSAFESLNVAKASAGVLYGLTGYNSSTSAQFIQVHNTAAVPNDAAAPVITFRAEASSNFFWDGSKFGKEFSTGITVVNSSAAATKVRQDADCWFNIMYE